MGFTDDERRLLMSLDFVGPGVLRRLEQLGLDSLGALAATTDDPETMALRIAERTGSTCWRNSPNARAALRAVLDLARRRASNESPE